MLASTDELAERQRICRGVVYFHLAIVWLTAAATFGWIDAIGHRDASIPDLALVCIFVVAGGLLPFPAILIAIVIASEGLPKSIVKRVLVAEGCLAAVHYFALVPLVQ